MSAKRGLGPLYYGAVRQPWGRGAAAGGWIVVSGIDGVVDDSGNEVPGIAGQTVVVLERLRLILAEAGATLDDIVSLDQYLADPGERSEYMRVRDGWLGKHAHGLLTRRDHASLLVYPRLASPAMRVEIRATAYHQDPTAAETP